MGCNCSKKNRIKHLINSHSQEQNKSQAKNTNNKLNMLKQMWEDAKEMDSANEKKETKE